MSILFLMACQISDKPIKDSLVLRDDYYEGFGIRRILLDPGHGCTDPGAQMRSPFSDSPIPKVPSEAEINLRAARVIQTHLEATGHYEVILSHEGHNCPSLGRRASMASKIGADVLISIHSDSGAPLTEGSWLIWSKHGYAAKQAAQNQWLATALGAGLYTHGFPLYHKDVSYDPSKKQSERYLKTHDHYAAHIDNGSRGLYLLKKSKVPTVLIETHFITSPNSVIFFHQDDTLQDFAVALEQGLLTFFAVNDGVHVATKNDNG